MFRSTSPIALLVAAALLLAHETVAHYWNLFLQKLDPDGAKLMTSLPDWQLMAAAICVLVAGWIWWRGRSAGRPVEEVVKVTITHKVFRNERVTLDGHKYVSCEFHNVTLVYSGGPYELSDNKFFGGFWIAPENETVGKTMALLAQLDWLKKPVMIGAEQMKPGIVYTDNPPDKQG